MNTEAFKRQIKCYRDCRDTLSKCYQKLDEVWYRFSGVSAIRYDKIPTMPSQSAIEQMKLAYSSKVETIEKEIARCKNQLDYLEYLLMQIEEDTRDAILEIYVDGHRYSDVAKKHFISKSGLQSRITNAILNVKEKV